MWNVEMTEEEWCGGIEPSRMLRFLLGTNFPRIQALEAFPDCKVSDRKLRLFACACYHRIRHLLPDPLARAAVEVAERFADGEATSEERERAAAQVRARLDAMEGRWRASRGAEHEALLPTHEALALGGMALWAEAPKAAYYAASNAHLAWAALMNPGEGPSGSGFFTSRLAEERAQADLLRCIFGNPFRPIVAEPAWRTPEVVALARAIHDDKAFDRLVVLADALADAGCNEKSILVHGRSKAGHARGCWVVDLVLGRT
ncbi:hypothetical protein [Polyangium sp. 15x6]|uniref:hypothetical protein n=1 Tax=Polyangium sp. 15x6 TaxID=3042687 RepID=UPI00249B882D|nr:hypothetical protein [Polyangium sp. 15x6]MDI3290167.1 hypothetical protein [Polyangium sp. 15x6]